MSSHFFAPFNLARKLISRVFILLLLSWPASVWSAEEASLLGQLWSVEQQAFSHPDELLSQLEPGSWLLIGEQHDHPEHQSLAKHWVQQLAEFNQLGVLALEMAHQGQQEYLDAALGNDEVSAEDLAWQEGWPWSRYQSLVVAGLTLAERLVAADLPREQQLAAYREGAPQPPVSDAQAKALDELIDLGHCELLPKERLPQMRQVQLARDQAMAKALQRSGATDSVNVFVAGSVHVRQDLGVPRWLPEPAQTVSVLLQQVKEGKKQPADYLPKGIEQLQAFDYVYFTSTRPPVDYCEALKKSLD